MDELNNSFPQNYHVCKSPPYDYVEPEQNQKIKQDFRTAEGPESSSMYGSLLGNMPHVYSSLQVPHKTKEGNADGQEKCVDSSMYGSLVEDIPHVYSSLQVPHKTQEGNADGQKKTLESSMYGSLVGNALHVYGSLQEPHETYKHDTFDSPVI
ncbi:uncharacterized protein LOC116291584 [Actinia tenebrosa]|uniref:Uncharacterized protein LOC116291584 n=1 Tax=Actinia tenebrosa TaxID=6105 RepID=A0A6P8HPQ1_ACTTE|nr:uncharacterized protein LOC116291584 [Actinia tenebrosa]